MGGIRGIHPLDPNHVVVHGIGLAVLRSIPAIHQSLPKGIKSSAKRRHRTAGGEDKSPRHGLGQKLTVEFSPLVINSKLQSIDDI